MTTLGYTKTTIMGSCGSEIICRSCGYVGRAEVISSTFCAGKLERCPGCRGKNYSGVREVIIMNWTQDEWTGCYPSSWKGVIAREAMSHPAKFSSKLIRKIYEHMKAEGWLKEGDTVLDPFGGVALGALDAMRLGLRWRGIELEAKFVDLGAHNIRNWNVKFSRMPHWCQDASLLKGDSRFLLRVLQGQNGDISVSSPPYADGAQHTGGNDPHPEKIEGGKYHGVGINGAVSSPPYADTDLHYKQNGLKVDGGEKYERPYMQGQGDENYGATDGQLGAMKADGFNAAISSPPFEERSADGGWQMLGKYAEQGKLTVKQVGGNGRKNYPSWNKDRDTSYGETEGQMGQMKSSDEGFAAAMKSPPFGNNDSAHAQTLEKRSDKSAQWIQKNTGWATGYGESDGQLAEMDMEGFSAAISSPPFRHSEGGTPEPKPGGSIDVALYARHAAGNSAAEGYGGTEGQLGNMDEGDFSAAVSSPPFLGTVSHDGGPAHQQGGALHSDYGGAEGQLANMSAKDFDGAVSSPPYNLPMSQEHNGKRGGKRGTTPSEDGAFVVYGNTEGQLEGMKDDGIDAALSSPPYDDSQQNYKAGWERFHKTREPLNKNDIQREEEYGKTPGQLSASDDFWMAARAIVEQVYLALAPSAHATWVVKGFVKNKEYVDFPDQWRRLCEAVGFVTVHEHRALLVHSKGISNTLDGGVVEHKTESKSFFRRLAEKKGSPRVDWETVWCMVKPAEAGK